MLAKLGRQEFVRHLKHFGGAAAIAPGLAYGLLDLAALDLVQHASGSIGECPAEIDLRPRTGVCGYDEYSPSCRRSGWIFDPVD